MYLAPPQNALITADGSVDVDIGLVAKSYPPSALLECYRCEVLDCINVDGLQNVLRAGEDDCRIARYVCLKSQPVQG